MDILNLQKSKLRQALLELYFAHPEKRYYLRELERRLNLPVAYIRHELLKLEKSGLFKSEFAGKERYFFLNQNFLLYNEIEKIVSKTIGIEAELTKQLKKVKGIDFAFLFGSYVKGDFRPDSDIDLYVIGEMTEDAVYQATRQAEDKIYRDINYHVSDPKEFKSNLEKSFFHKEILRNNLLLIGDKNGFRKFINQA